MFIQVMKIEVVFAGSKKLTSDFPHESVIFLKAGDALVKVSQKHVLLLAAGFANSIGTLMLLVSNFKPSSKICLKRLADVCRQEVFCRMQRFIRIAYVTPVVAKLSVHFFGECQSHQKRWYIIKGT